MQNPITQLKQHKTAQLQQGANCNAKTESNAITPPTTKHKQAQKADDVGKTKLTFQPFTQVSYIFQQAKWNTANCKVNHPDCFHFKKQMQQGAVRISKNLAIANRLLDELAESIVMTDKQKQEMKSAINAVRYLQRQFKGVADYVEQVEQAQGEELEALCYRKG